MVRVLLLLLVACPDEATRPDAPAPAPARFVLDSRSRLTGGYTDAVDVLRDTQTGLCYAVTDGNYSAVALGSVPCAAAR